MLGILIVHNQHDQDGHRRHFRPVAVQLPAAEESTAANTRHMPRSYSSINVATGTTVWLPKTSNQARGLARYAIDFLYSNPLEIGQATLDRLELFHIDSVGCGEERLHRDLCGRQRRRWRRAFQKGRAEVDPRRIGG